MVYVQVSKGQGSLIWSRDVLPHFKVSTDPGPNPVDKGYTHLQTETAIHMPQMTVVMCIRG